MIRLSIDLPFGFLEPEPRTIVVTPKRKQLWAVALDLLSQFDRVCTKYKIRYFCDGGTSLGAARHKGFIPWDDDLDVIMARPEYNKLCAIAPSEFIYPYFWQTNETDPGSARGHAQLRHSETTCIMKTEMRNGKPLFDFNQGVFIDVFPFDNIPDDLDERKEYINEMSHAKAAVRCAKEDLIRIYEVRNNPSLRTFYHGIKPLIREMTAYCLEKDRLTIACRALEELSQKYSLVETEKMAPISFNPCHREILPAVFFDEVEFVDFEFMRIPVLKNYKEALKINYGNWEEHIIGSSCHGGMFVDLDRPYTDYLI